MTPKKRRPPAKHSRLVTLFGHEAKHRRAKERLENLLKAPAGHLQLDEAQVPEENLPQELDELMEDSDEPDGTSPVQLTRNTDARRRRNRTEEMARTLGHWSSLLPTLIPHFIRYANESNGRPSVHARPEDCISKCDDGSCTRTTASVVCLYWDCEHDSAFLFQLTLTMNP